VSDQEYDGQRFVYTIRADTFRQLVTILALLTPNDIKNFTIMYYGSAKRSWQ